MTASIIGMRLFFFFFFPLVLSRKKRGFDSGCFSLRFSSSLAPGRADAVLLFSGRGFELAGPLTVFYFIVLCVCVFNINDLDFCWPKKKKNSGVSHSKIHINLDFFNPPPPPCQMLLILIGVDVSPCFSDFWVFVQGGRGWDGRRREEGG